MKTEQRWSGPGAQRNPANCRITFNYVDGADKELCGIHICWIMWIPEFLIGDLVAEFRVVRLNHGTNASAERQVGSAGVADARHRVIWISDN